MYTCTGVGKTAIVEGLAQRIIAGDVPPGLLGSQLLELDLAALAAGCMMPGEFEVNHGGRAAQLLHAVVHPFGGLQGNGRRLLAAWCTKHMR